LIIIISLESYYTEIPATKAILEALRTKVKIRFPHRGGRIYVPDIVCIVPLQLQAQSFVT